MCMCFFFCLLQCCLIWCLSHTRVGFTGQIFLAYIFLLSLPIPTIFQMALRAQMITFISTTTKGNFPFHLLPPASLSSYEPLLNEKIKNCLESIFEQLKCKLGDYSLTNGSLLLPLNENLIKPHLYTIKLTSRSYCHLLSITIYKISPYSKKASIRR